MAFYPFDKTLTMGGILRDGLDDMRSGRYKLAHALGVLSSMSNAQVESEFGFAPGTGGAAKAELQSGIGNFLSSDGTTTAVASAAVLQMLNQFG